ncbi:hypothetical protein [Aeromonas allosaccharophila]|uniref:hypothetical protein n=1 Tax=Aeromonas allosaccharophila TaxID=656 RepID=UPI000A7508B4|nr:hypothetical protein [Aeromonas allosaccharophila]
MLTRSQDTTAVLLHLQGQLKQLRTDLEQDMEHEQTQASRAQIRLLDKLIKDFTPAE